MTAPDAGGNFPSLGLVLRASLSTFGEIGRPAASPIAFAPTRCDLFPNGGLQDFTITRTADPSQFGCKLVDTKTGLPQSDYSRVTLELIIGNDSGRVDLTLAQASNGLWHLA